MLKGITLRGQIFFYCSKALYGCEWELCKDFYIGLGVRWMYQSVWVFNICMHDCTREMKTKIDLDAGLKVRGMEQSLVANPFADNTVLLAENERMV